MMDPGLHHLRINAERFRRHFEVLARIGATPEGGIWRPALGETDALARQWYRETIEAGGLTYTCDAAGNQSALLHGDNNERPHLILGSHLDSVPNGGRFDGALGVLAALEILLTLKEAEYRPPLGLEAINFSDEEGYHVGTLGSRALAGKLVENDLQNPFRGLTAFDAGLARLGLSRKTLFQARRPARGLAAFLELHIEQGPVLENAGVDIGVVAAIVGIGRLTLVFRGQSDHAGTTPMDLRRDAGAAAGDFTTTAWQALRGDFPDCVINIGDMRFRPGAFNVVPHTVELDLEFRAPDERQLSRLQAALIDLAKAVARDGRVELNPGPTEITPAVRMDTRMQDLLVREARRLGLSHRRMSSGAGHDAQSFADICPTGMIFIPSVAGCSHSPREYSEWVSCLNGVNVMLQSLLAMTETYRHQGAILG